MYDCETVTDKRLQIGSYHGDVPVVDHGQLKQSHWGEEWKNDQPTH